MQMERDVLRALLKSGFNVSGFNGSQRMNTKSSLALEYLDTA
jgi:hypothetical protein